MKFISVSQAAELLQIKVSTVRYMIFKKQIPFYKVGRSIRFSEQDLVSWVLGNKQGGLNE